MSCDCDHIFWSHAARSRDKNIVTEAWMQDKKLAATATAEGDIVSSFSLDTNQYQPTKLVDKNPYLH